MVFVAALSAAAHAETKVVVVGGGDAPVTTPVHVTVHITLPPATAAAITPPAPLDAPGVVAIAPVSERLPDPYDRSHRILFEAGATFTTASLGAELELSMPIAGRLRFGVAGGASTLFGMVANDFLPNTTMWDGALELRYTGRGRTHFDVGLLGGLITGTQSVSAAAGPDGAPMTFHQSDTGQILGLRLALVRELNNASGVEFALEPLVIMGLSQDFAPAPAGLSMMASARWELAL